MSDIANTLDKLFKNHRIIFWYDEEELRLEYEALSLSGVEKIELENNEYSLKYRILRGDRKQKFLLYHEGPQPADLENWLLDVQLAQATFSADQVSLWIAELGLRQEHMPLVREHADFFEAASRRKKLKARLKSEDSHAIIRIKMLAVCVNAGTESRLESVLEVLLVELADEQDEKIKRIKRCKLDLFLWERVGRHFGYQSDTPGVRDFAIELFKSGYALCLEEDAALNQDALVFLKRWKEIQRYQQAFETLSAYAAKIISLETDLQNREMRSLIDIDLFRLIDQRIISNLVQQVVKHTITEGDCTGLIWPRRTTHWFYEFQDIYKAIQYGSQFITQLTNANLNMHSFEDGIVKYQEIWFQIDYVYRKFIFHLRASKQATLLSDLAEQIENLYSNNFLLKLNDNWQQVIDQAQTWDVAPFYRQHQFYEHWVAKELKTSKIAVVISDALRYEIGHELQERIRAEEGYSATLDTMLSMLPSYTQLGMAALLPHRELKIIQDGMVEVDGQNSSGTNNRAKILDTAIVDGATAILATDLLAMSRDDYRQATKGYRLIYVYHNQIDQVGDKRDSEGRVFDAAETTLSEIMDILKKLYDSYFATVLITSDHGFIYQNQLLDESEFASSDIRGDDELDRSRRYLIGKGITPNASVKQFKTADLGLIGDYDIFIPKSINRMRVRGAGSRYVHGGAALQEVVLPVIRVNKKRVKDITQVDIDVIASASSIITTGQLSVAFYQTEPVSAKLQPRRLRAGIYSRDGDLISDLHELNFDLSSENEREREVHKRFVLSSKADDVNNQTVYLKLEEQEYNTSHYQEYKLITYQLRRSFTSDFDF